MIGVLLSCVYTIYPTDQVLLTRLGAPEAVITEPGLHFKIPFYQYANFMPRHLLTLEAASQEVIASDKKRLEVSTFAHWRIVMGPWLAGSMARINSQRATVAALSCAIVRSKSRTKAKPLKNHAVTKNPTDH